MTQEFNLLGLDEQVVQALAELGYQAPTPVQKAVIPFMLTGQDVIGQAQTGTGKTAAFALPMIQNLITDRDEIQGLVVAPTRELVLQVTKAIHTYGRNQKVRVLAVYGGQPYERQIRRLKSGVDIVVGTPGRLLDLLRRKVLDLSQLQTLVLDEADEMLSMGFIEDIEAILSCTPDKRQTALFSATLPAEIRRLAGRYMVEPQSITIKGKQLTVEAIEQRYYLVHDLDKLAALTRLFEVETVSSALVFARTRAGTGELANELVKRGYLAEALNGDLLQDARERVLSRFRQGQIQVLVATDVAARGLDIDDISHVFNYDLPADPEIYVHRVGRTGRAGKTGTAISLVSPGEIRRLNRIENFARRKIERAELPTVDDIHNYREKQLLIQVEKWLKRGRCRREREIAEDLVAAGHDPLEIAAVALKLARSEEKQRPIDEIGVVVEAPQEKPTRLRKSSNGRKNRNHGNLSHESGMVRLNLNRGKIHGVRPNDIVSTIAYHANIPGSTLGKISINKKYSFVDVPEEYLAKVLANADLYRIRKQTITVKVA